MKTYQKALLFLLPIIVIFIFASCGTSSSLNEQNSTVDENTTYIIGSVKMSDYSMDVAISVDEKTAYIAGWESGLQIIDISNPDAPIIIGAVDAIGTAYSIKLFPDGNRALIGALEDGIKIIDISEPKHPLVIGSMETIQARAVALSNDGTKAYIADNASLKIVDITDPTALKIIGNLDLDGTILGITLSSDGKTAFLVGDEINLQIINIEESASPFSVNRIENRGLFTSIVLSKDNTKAFVSSNGVFEIFDISDFLSPSLIGEYYKLKQSDLTNLVLSSDETKVYAADYYQGISVIDIRNLAHPVEVASYDSYRALAVQLSSDETKAFVSGGEELTILDLNEHVVQSFTATVSTDTKGKTFLGTLHMSLNHNVSPESLILIGQGSEKFTIKSTGELYVAPDAVFDYLTPSYTLSVVAKNGKTRYLFANINIAITPFISSFQLPDGDIHVETWDVYLSSEYTKAFITTYRGLIIMDISNPSELSYLGQIMTSEMIRDFELSVDEQMAFTIYNSMSSYNNSSFQILDIRDPAKPSVMSTLEIPYRSVELTCSLDGKKVFIVDSQVGLHIIDVSDPMHPFLVSTLKIEGLDDVSLSNDDSVIYVGNRDHLIAIDVHSPENPFIIRSLETSSFDAILFSKDKMLLFLTSWGGGELQIVDISDPVSLRLESLLKVHTHIYDVTFSNHTNQLFVYGSTEHEENVALVNLNNIHEPFIEAKIDMFGYPYLRDIEFNKAGNNVFGITDDFRLVVLDLHVNPAP